MRHPSDYLCNHQSGISPTDRLRSVVFCDDVDASSLAIKHDLTIDQGEQSVILALSNTSTGVKLVAYLPNDNMACANRFATEFLDATALCIGIATVATGTLTLLMCHFSYLISFIFCKPRSLSVDPEMIKAFDKPNSFSDDFPELRLQLNHEV